MEKITAMIPAGNEADNIVEAVKSVLWADEVYVVVDESSADGNLRTGEIRLSRY